MYEAQLNEGQRNRTTPIDPVTDPLATGATMRTMIVGVVAVVLVLAAGGTGVGQPPGKLDAKLLVGTWVPKKKTGEQITLEFTADGKTVLDRDKPSRSTGTYKLDGDKLTWTHTFQGKEFPVVWTVHSLTKAEIVVSGDRLKNDVLVRVEGAGKK
jgi:uncharacterized protein (TIGR03066 family)